MFSFCLKACKTTSRTVSKDNDVRPSIDSTESLSKYKGCTEIEGNLNIRIRGTASSGNFVMLIRFWLFVTTATLNPNNPLTTKSNYVKINLPTYQPLMNNLSTNYQHYFPTTYQEPTNNLPNNLSTPLPWTPYWQLTDNLLTTYKEPTIHLTKNPTTSEH